MLPRPGVKRFLLVTLGITGLYLALNALWLALTPSLVALFDARSASAWARDAAAVADAARDADGRLPVATRVAAYRLDSDELGLAARVEKAMSPRHRHLLLLGMHVGVAAALNDMSGGKLQNPLRQYIGRHATLAGVPPASWEPAARAGEGATPEQQAAAYQAALTALDMAVAELGPVQ